MTRLPPYPSAARRLLFVCLLKCQPTFGVIETTGRSATLVANSVHQSELVTVTSNNDSDDDLGRRSEGPHVWQWALLGWLPESLVGELDTQDPDETTSIELQKHPKRSLWGSFVFATVSTLVLNLPDVLWLASCVELAGFAVSTSIYLGMMILSLIVALLFRNAAYDEDVKYPKMAHDINDICQAIGPVVLLAATAYLFHEWYFSVTPAHMVGKGSDSKHQQGELADPEEIDYDALEVEETNNLVGVKLVDFVVVAVAASVDSFALDMWLFFEGELNFFQILVGCIAGSVATMICALFVNKIPFIMNTLAMMPLFGIVGFLTLLAFVSLLSG